MALLQLILTEWRQFWREPGSLLWTLAFPIGLAAALGLGVSRSRTPIYRIGIDSETPLLLSRLKQVKTNFNYQVLPWKEGVKALQRGQILIFITVDSATNAVAYLDNTNSQAAQALMALENACLKQQVTKDPFQIVPVTAHGHRYIDFLVPGLLAMSIMNSCLWGIGWALVEYRMKKFLYRMIATPMRKTDFLLAQIITRVILLAIELGLLLTFAYWFFDVQLQGSWIAFITMVLAGTWSFSGMAFLLSSRTAKTAIANGIINAITLPMTLVSGIFFSYEGFPEWLQVVIRWLPLTLLTDNLRGIFNEAYSLWQVLTPAALLVGLGSTLFAIALKIYKWK